MTSRSRGWKSWAGSAVLLSVALGGGWWWHPRSTDAALGAGRLAARGGPHAGPTWQADDASETSIRGLVSDLERRPIANAEICASVASYASRHFRAAVCTHSDAEGTYQLSGLEALPYTLTAQAAGFVASAAGADAALVLRAGEARSGVDLQLRAGEINLHGTVADATGGPVPNANVRAERTRLPRLVVDTVTDDLGNFAFAVPDGPLLLQAAASGYSSMSKEVVAPSADARLVLVPGASLRGRVVSKQSGLPVAGVELRAEPFGAQPESLAERPRSDARGSFAIEGLEPGSYVVTAIGTGLRGESEAPYELALGQVIDDVEISVREMAQVSGQVLRSDGQSCQRGWVQLGAPDPLSPLPDTKDQIDALLAIPPVAAEIGAEGKVHFAAVVPGKYYVNVRCQEQMLQDGPRVLEVAGDDLLGLVWRVGDGASLRVLTLDELGQPVGGVDFLVQRPSPGAYADHSLPARSDAQGRCDFTGILPPGTYGLVAANYYSARPVKVVVRANEQNLAKLKLVGSAAIEVTLRAGAEPVEGMKVTAVQLEARGEVSAAGEVGPAVATELGAGRYRVAPLPAGRYEVRVQDGINPGVASEALELASGAKVQLALALDRAGKISGRVLDDRGNAVADAWVSAVAEGLSAGEGTGEQRAAFATLLPARVLTDAQGEFSFERLAAGSASYAVQVSVPGAGAAQARAVHADNTRLELALRAVGSVEGYVDGVCGKDSPYPVAVQTQSLDTGQMLGPTTLSPEGTFAINGVAPGAVRVSAFCEHPDGLVVGVTTAQLAPSQKLSGVRVSLLLRGQGSATASK
jgi:protocatechuate 3,4-dioxygenase beta subunit